MYFKNIFNFLYFFTFCIRPTVQVDIKKSNIKYLETERAHLKYLNSHMQSLSTCPEAQVDHAVMWLYVLSQRHQGDSGFGDPPCARPIDRFRF
jgi:hypothetical protein